MENSEIKAALVMLLNQVNAMREAQKYYFKNRSKQAFYTSINMENMVDDSIPRLYAYVASIEQSSGRVEMNKTPTDLSVQNKEEQATEDIQTDEPKKKEKPENTENDTTNQKEDLPF